MALTQGGSVNFLHFGGAKHTEKDTRGQSVPPVSKQAEQLHFQVCPDEESFKVREPERDSGFTGPAGWGWRGGGHAVGQV